MRGLSISLRNEPEDDCCVAGGRTRAGRARDGRRHVRRLHKFCSALKPQDEKQIQKGGGGGSFRVTLNSTTCKARANVSVRTALPPVASIGIGWV